MSTVHKHIYFVRHGQSESNAGAVLQGPHGRLTEQGRKQAEATAKRVADLGVEEVIASTYERAHETASIIATHNDLSLTLSDLFVERRRPSELIGYHKDDPYVEEVNRKISEHYTDPDWRYKDTENFFDLKERATSALKFLEERTTQTLLVVSHGTFLRLIAGCVLHNDQFTADMMLQYTDHLRTENTGITYCEIRESDKLGLHWSLISWNDQAHL